MTRTAAALAASLLCLLPAPVAAGTWVNPYTGSTWNNPISSQLETMIRGRLLRESMEREAGKRKGSAPAASAGATLSRLTYRPAASRTAQEFAASLLQDPRERAELARSLEGTLVSYRAGAEKVGRKDDVAFALSFFITGNYAVYAQRDVSDEAVVAVAGQLDVALATMPGLRQASDVQRQGFAELLVCSTAFVLAGYQQGTEQNDEQQKQTYRVLAAALLKQTVGVEAERLSVTDAGMEVKGPSAR